MNKQLSQNMIMNIKWLSILYNIDEDEDEDEDEQKL
jgi:hypothetical protein